MKKLSKLLKALSGTVSWSLTRPVSPSSETGQPAATQRGIFSKKKLPGESDQPGTCQNSAN
jgi:hypothetical protein